MKFQPLGLSAYTLTTSIGCGVAENMASLKSNKTGLRQTTFSDTNLDTWLGKIDMVADVKMPATLAKFICRNNQLALLALAQDDFENRIQSARTRYGASRVGVFIGTSTSGGHSTELAYAERRSGAGSLPDWYEFKSTENSFSVTDFVQHYFQLHGPAFTIATACSSSAKVFAAAHRYVAAGLCDAAIVGGVDSLCLTALYGFNSLQLISERICSPWDGNRNGINLGEGAGFVLLEKPAVNESSICLLGYGESSDAYHMSSPHPEGKGAVLAMQKALACQDIEAAELDYINLHGTGTRANDAAEDKAIQMIFPNTPCSSTKGWTGHTLGAAGIIESLFCGLCLEHDFLPGNLNLQNQDPELKSHILSDNQQGAVNMCMSNSFGFGGSNCSLLLGKTV